MHRNFKSLASPRPFESHICIAEDVVGIVLRRCAIILTCLDITSYHVSGRCRTCALGTGYLAGHKSLAVREIRNGNRRIPMDCCELQLRGLIMVTATQSIEGRLLARIGRTVIVDDPHPERQLTAGNRQLIDEFIGILCDGNLTADTGCRRRRNSHQNRASVRLTCTRKRHAVQTRNAV